MIKLTIKNILNSYINSLLLILSVIIAILSFSIGVGYINFFYKSEMDKSLLSEESSKITINLEIPAETDTMLKFLKSNNESTIISGEFAVTKNNKRIFLSGVTFKNTFSVKSIPLYSGRFFSVDDISSASKVALVGYNHKDLITKINNIDYIQIEGENYKVIGYIGRDTSSYWNGSVLVPMDSVPTSLKREESQNFDYLVFNKDSSNSEFLRAKNYFGKNYKNSSVLGSFNTKGLGEILYSKRTFLYSIGLLIAIAVTNIINFTYNWCRKNRKNFSILLLLGYNKKHLSLILSLSFAIIVIPAFIIAVFLNIGVQGLLTEILSVSIKFKYENFYTGILFSITLVILCLSINYLYITRANLASELRR